MKLSKKGKISGEEIKEARKEPHSKDNTQKLLGLWQKFSDAEDF